MTLVLQKGHFSQGPEDLVLEAIFREKPPGHYIDVGANHPVYGNNTYRLYQMGWRGICLDPFDAFTPLYTQFRPDDRFLAVAAGDTNGEAEFFFGEHHVLASLKRRDDIHDKVAVVPKRRLDVILREVELAGSLDVVSVDVEGAEAEVLDGLDLDHNRPRIIVAEYNTSGEINGDLQNYLLKFGYHILFVTAWNFIATRELDQDWKVLHP